jgi:hypothetical protein
LRREDISRALDVEKRRPMPNNALARDAMATEQM